MPTRCNRGFYCRSYCFLNMFRAPLCPSSGAQEYYTVVAACGIFVLWFSSSWSGVELRVMCPVCRMLQHPANRTVWFLTQAVHRQATTNSRREWHCHMLHVYNSILLKSTWESKNVEENNILWINNNQCIKLVINICVALVTNLLPAFWCTGSVRPGRVKYSGIWLLDPWRNGSLVSQLQ